MPDLPINNETDFSLTSTMLAQIKRDAIENFGESVRSIKVQYGIERHAFNVKTGEVRYAFSPGDFGLVDTALSLPELYFHRSENPVLDDDAAEELLPGAFEDLEQDEESSVTESLESLEEAGAEDEDEAEDAGVVFQELDEDEDEDEDEQFDDIDDENSFAEYDDDYN